MSKEDFADRITPDRVSHLDENEVIVFGSDVDGSHSGGLAEIAVRKFGALRGCGEGLQGQSYAIPTVGVSREEMQAAVDRFLDFAQAHPEKKFLVTRIGCGHGGYAVDDVATMFVYAPKCANIFLPLDFWMNIM